MRADHAHRRDGPPRHRPSTPERAARAWARLTRGTTRRDRPRAPDTCSEPRLRGPALIPEKPPPPTALAILTDRPRTWRNRQRRPKAHAAAGLSGVRGVTLPRAHR